MHYQVVIIGGGPSGTGAGITLQKAGVRTCIVDKAQFPRQKLCGGLVTRKTKDLLNSIITDRTEEEIWGEVSSGGHTQLSLYNRFEKAVSVEIGVPYDTVYRKVYDDYLVRYYQEKGGVLMDGKLPVRLDTYNRELELQSGEILTYDYLIAADGANSWVGHRLGRTFGGKLFCLEINIRKEDFDYDGIGIYFDVIGVGYAWVFPKNDLYCIGLGSTRKDTKQYRAIFQDFLQRIGVRNWESYPMRAAFVPGGGFLKKPVFGERVLFVGDAAGFADPLTGEGLFWSMYSGKQAAEAIIGAAAAVAAKVPASATVAASAAAVKDSAEMSAKDFATAAAEVPVTATAAADYLQRCKPIQKNIKSVLRTRILFHPPLYQFWLKNVGGHPNFVRYFSDHQLSQYEGEGAVSELLKKVPRRYLKHFFKRNV